MTDAAQIVDHSDRGIARALATLTGKPRLEAFLRSWLDSAQELEDVVYALRAMMLVSSATGVWLERLGKIVGQPKEGRTDEVYRVWIMARTLVNRSSGTAPQLLAIVEALVPDGVSIYTQDEYPAALTVHVYGVIDYDTGDAIAQLLQRARCPGVRLLFHWHVTDDAELFKYSDDGTYQASSPTGYDAGLYSCISDGSAVSPTLANLDFSRAENGAHIATVGL